MRLPRRWVVERTFAWAARFRRLAKDYERLAKDYERLAKDYERLPETLAGLHYVVFALLMLVRAAHLLQSP